MDSGTQGERTFVMEDNQNKKERRCIKWQRIRPEKNSTGFQSILGMLEVRRLP